MRSRVSTGEDDPPASASFQSTCLSGPISTGSPLDSPSTPAPFWPRNPGQIANPHASAMPQFISLTSQALHDFAVELRVRLPGLRCHDITVSHGLAFVPSCLGQLHLGSDVFVAGDAFAFEDACGGEYLDAV